MLRELLKTIYNKLFNTKSPTNHIEGNGNRNKNIINNYNTNTDNSTKVFFNGGPTNTNNTLVPELEAKRRVFNENFGIIILVGGFFYASYFMYNLFINKTLNTFGNPLLLFLVSLGIANLLKVFVKKQLRKISKAVLNNDKLLDNLLAYFDINLRQNHSYIQVEGLFLLFVLCSLIIIQLVIYTNHM